MDTNQNSNNGGGRSNHEGGHAKNVAQFQKLITRCELLPDFNPPNPIIYLLELQAYRTTADNAIVSVHQRKSTSDITINERQKEFERLDSVSTRTVNILEVIANEKKIVADARTILRRIRGEVSKPKTDENLPGQEAMSPRSNSQQSYDKLIDHFRALIELVKQVPGYEPNEAELTIAGLSAYHADLVMKNNNVTKANTQLSKARKTRDKLLYNTIDGLLQRAKLVKLYVKSLYSASSLEYKEISKIKFTLIQP